MKTKIKQSLVDILVLTMVLCTLSGCGRNSEKSILGKWYNLDGDCLEVFSDNTYNIKFVQPIGTTIGSGNGEWDYLTEEDFFKFYSNDGKVWQIELIEEKGTLHFNYSYYGEFYKDSVPKYAILENEEKLKEEEEKRKQQYTVVPKFVGKKYTDVANDEKYNNIFKFKVVLQNYENYEDGIIYSQSVESGKEVVKGTTITLCVSIG